MAGDLYLADDPELEAALQLATELADRYHKQVLAKDPSATDTLHQLFGEVGEDIWIRPRSTSTTERTFTSAHARPSTSTSRHLMSLRSASAPTA